MNHLKTKRKSTSRANSVQLWRVYGVDRVKGRMLLSPLQNFLLQSPSTPTTFLKLAAFLKRPSSTSTNRLTKTAFVLFRHLDLLNKLFWTIKRVLMVKFRFLNSAKQQTNPNDQSPKAELQCCWSKQTEIANIIGSTGKQFISYWPKFYCQQFTSLIFKIHFWLQRFKRFFAWTVGGDVEHDDVKHESASA